MSNCIALLQTLQILAETDSDRIRLCVSCILHPHSTNMLCFSQNSVKPTSRRFKLGRIAVRELTRMQLTRRNRRMLARSLQSDGSAFSGEGRTVFLQKKDNRMHLQIPGPTLRPQYQQCVRLDSAPFPSGRLHKGGYRRRTHLGWFPISSTRHNATDLDLHYRYCCLISIIMSQ